MSPATRRFEITAQSLGTGLCVPIVLAFLIAGMIWLGWVGYIGSDDTMYASGALGWLRHFPYIGDSHWTLRQTIVIPIALAFRLFSVSEFALILPCLLYVLALLGLVYFVLARHFDRLTGGFAVGVLITLPLLADQASLVVPDFAETFFCLLSMTLFFEATTQKKPHRLLLLAGIAAGFAWETRETAAFFLVTYGVLFLVGFGFPRRLYLLMAASFLAVVGIEWLYFAVMTGDPFYRLVTDLRTHLRVDLAAGGADAVAGALEKTMTGVEQVKGYGGLSRTGNLQVNRFIDPILAVLVNHQFMFVYYLAVPAAIGAAFLGERRDERQWRFVRLFGLAGLIWFIFLYLQIGMSLQPRYYTFPTVILIMVFAVWLRGALARNPGRATFALGFVLITNFLGVYVDNHDPIFAIRALRDFAQHSPGPVYTDPDTASRGEFLYRIAHVNDRIIAGPPRKGALYFYNPKYLSVEIAQANTSTRAKLDAYLPQPDWKVVWRRDSGQKWSGLIINVLGLKRFFPESIFRRLDKPNADAVVYRP